ncbi:MAG: YidC/Oxa1 family membrane protein insertase [Bacilli bacterium]|nr:YidC/Oxa1 family membrane protein insertase [Bacilli bacterium]
MKKKFRKIMLLLAVVFILTGCTTVLKDKKNNVVYYENDKVKITLNKNILCQPEDKGVIKKYNEYKDEIDISKLPKCSKMKLSDSTYEGIWENIFVKPLAWLLIKINGLFGNYGISIIVLGLLLRLILAPFTHKTAMQSENMKEMQPEIDRINKKYEGKKDQQSMQQKSMETMQVYKKYGVNPLSSCLFAFIQIPLLIAFYEAANRVPVIFEGNLFGLVLGTTPLKAMQSGHWEYIIIVLLIVGTTIISQKLNKTASSPQSGGVNPNMMMNIMVIMIAIMSINFSVALSLYWIASTIFTIGQNLLVKYLKKRKTEKATK